MDSKWTDSGKVLALKSDMKDHILGYPGTAAPGDEENGQRWTDTTNHRVQWYLNGAYKRISDLIIPGGGDDLLLLDGIMSCHHQGFISYKDADELYIDGNAMMVNDKIAYWDSQLTYTVSSGSSAWHYIYLDYSAITNRTAITTSEIIDSTTAPTYSHSLKGWYNGNDRCIGCYLGDGSDILPFTWTKDGMYLFDTPIQEYSDTNGGSASFGDVDLTSSVPDFGEMNVYVRVYAKDPDILYVELRKNGSTYSYGTALYGTDPAETNVTHWRKQWVTTDSSQIIEVYQDNGTQEGIIHTLGFQLTL